MLIKMQGPSTEPSREALVPRIKTGQFAAALAGLDLPPDEWPHTEPLAADLLVAYAFDLPHMFQMASLAAITALGIGPDEARGVAVANLQRRLSRVEVVAAGPVRRVVTGDNLEACVLLADAVWADLAAGADGDLVVAVPSRDVLLVGDRAAVPTLRAVAADVLRVERVHALSDRLLVRRGGRWEEYAA